MKPVALIKIQHKKGKHIPKMYPILSKKNRWIRLTFEIGQSREKMFSSYCLIIIIFAHAFHFANLEILKKKVFAYKALWPILTITPAVGECSFVLYWLLRAAYAKFFFEATPNNKLFYTATLKLLCLKLFIS